MTAAQQLKNLLGTGKTFVAPGVFDGLSARLVEQAGFEVVYASGGAIARSTGTPDIGLLTMSEVVARLQQITDVVNIPVIADADTGYGNTINVARAVHEFQRAGVAGMHLEDQTFPKRCGHLSDKSVVPCDEMAHKIKVAAAEKDADFLLIARTDAIAVEGFDAALQRAEAYADAGADMLFVEAPETVEQIEQIAEKIKQPKLINMFYGGKTPLVPVPRLQELGYQLVIIPSDLQRAAIKAMQTTLAAIHKDGDSAGIQEQLVSFKDREAIIDTASYLADK